VDQLAIGRELEHRLGVGGAHGSKLLRAEAQILREQQWCQGIGLAPNGRGWRSKRHLSWQKVPQRTVFMLGPMP
jgi:hypothetical protein